MIRNLQDRQKKIALHWLDDSAIVRAIERAIERERAIMRLLKEWLQECNVHPVIGRINATRA